jgi:hypothetical protein
MAICVGHWLRESLPLSGGADDNIPFTYVSSFGFAVEAAAKRPFCIAWIC